LRFFFGLGIKTEKFVLLVLAILLFSFGSFYNPNKFLAALK
jgi:hypothetical protein